MWTMTCVQAGVMYQPYSTAQPLPTSPYLPPSTTATSSISYLSPPPLLASSASSPPSHPHYQEQALPLKRELVDTVRYSRSAFLLSFGISAKLNKRLRYWWTIAGRLC